MNYRVQTQNVPGKIVCNANLNLKTIFFVVVVVVVTLTLPHDSRQTRMTVQKTKTNKTLKSFLCKFLSRSKIAQQNENRKKLTTTFRHHFTNCCQFKFVWILDINFFISCVLAFEMECWRNNERWKVILKLVVTFCYQFSVKNDEKLTAMISVKFKFQETVKLSRFWHSKTFQIKKLLRFLRTNPICSHHFQRRLRAATAMKLYDS